MHRRDTTVIRSHNQHQLWFAVGTAAVVAAVALLFGARVGDLLVAYWAEGVVLLGVSYARILRSAGSVTEEDLDRLRGRKNGDQMLPCVAVVEPFLGQPLPLTVRRQVARELMQHNAWFVLGIGPAVLAIAHGVLGGVTWDPWLWLMLLVSLSVQHVVAYLAWARSDAPSTETFNDAGNAPIWRVLAVFGMAMVAGMVDPGVAPTAVLVTLIAAKGFVDGYGRLVPLTDEDTSEEHAEPGWYPMPDGALWRWWDGQQWTEHTHPMTPDSPPAAG